MAHVRPVTGRKTVRRFLMSRPQFFEVSYSINPWMNPQIPVDRALAVEQWENLRSTYLALGHGVELIDPVPMLPDMVFAANGATVFGRKVYSAKFRNAERVAEGAVYAEWFAQHGYDVREAEQVNEGQGDFLIAGGRLLAGTGFRTSVAAHGEVRDYFGLPTETLTLVDPRFYHLDTAMVVLNAEDIAYYPPAFSPESRDRLKRLFPQALIATDQDAEVFGLNAVSDGQHVVISPDAIDLSLALKQRGYEPVPVVMTELLKAGGGIKCCTLDLTSWVC